MSAGIAQPVAVVTGASRGIGAATATRLADEGYVVWSVARGIAPDARVRSIACDLADQDALGPAVRRILEENTSVDALVTNAAVRNLGQVAELPLRAWHEAVAVNLSSVVTLVQALLPALRRARGRIVVMGSHAGSISFEGGLAYCATKAALKPLVEVLLLEERSSGVLTTLLSPGAVANEEDDHSRAKIDVASLAAAVSWILATPRDLVVGEMEVRPALLGPKPVAGFDRLQMV